MITQSKPVHGDVLVKVQSVHLVPAPGWKDKPENPNLQFLVKVNLPLLDRELGEEVMFRGSFFVPTALDDEGKPYLMGIESASGMTPTAAPSDVFGANPAEKDGEIAVDANGFPIPREGQEKYSTYCFPRIVHTKAGAHLKLTEFSVSPSVIQEGNLKGTFAHLPAENGGLQCLLINDIEAWEPVIRSAPSAADRAGAVTGNVVNANTLSGAHVPQWIVDARESRKAQ